MGLAAISASLTEPPSVGDISHWFPCGCQYRKVGTGAGGGVLPPSLPPIVLDLEPEDALEPGLELDLDPKLDLEDPEEELRELEEEEPVLVIGMLTEPELEV